jgi:hypothetical protein
MINQGYGESHAVARAAGSCETHGSSWVSVASRAARVWSIWWRSWAVWASVGVVPLTVSNLIS